MGYPYAHQFPEQLRGLVLLDGNIPGVTLRSTFTLGPDNWRNWHFLFNAIPDLPEALMTGRERVVIEWFLSRKALNWTATFSSGASRQLDRQLAPLGDGDDQRPVCGLGSGRGCHGDRAALLMGGNSLAPCRGR